MRAVEPSVLLSITSTDPSPGTNSTISATSFICAYQAVLSESLCQVLCIYCVKKNYPEPDSWGGVHSIPLVMCLVNALLHCSTMISPRLFLHAFQESSTSQVRIEQTNALQRNTEEWETWKPSWVPKADKTIWFNHANTSNQVEHILELGTASQTCHNRESFSNSTWSSFNRCTLGEQMN